MLAATIPALQACNKGAPKDAAAETAPTTMAVGPENVAVVTLAELSSGPAVSGALQAEREATIRAEIGGSVLETMADQGSRVSAGAPLARIDATAINDTYLSAKSAVTSAELVAALHKSAADARAAFAETNDEHLLTPWRVLARGNVVLEAPRYEMIQDTINHWAHHRGQLTVYLRLLGAKVPAIYGPSADDSQFR